MKFIKKLGSRLLAVLVFLGLWFIGGCVVTSFFGPMGLLGQAVWLLICLRVARELKTGLFDD